MQGCINRLGVWRDDVDDVFSMAVERWEREIVYLRQGRDARVVGSAIEYYTPKRHSIQPLNPIHVPCRKQTILIFLDTRVRPDYSHFQFSPTQSDITLVSVSPCMYNPVSFSS